MSLEVKLPELGEGIESGDVVSILVSVGDSVDADQTILELETNKATVELPSPSAGVVQELKVKEGDNLSIGSVVLILNESEGASSASPAQEEQPKEEAKAKKSEVPAQPTKTSAAQPAAPVNIPKQDIPIPAGPSVRRRARQQGVDLYQLLGTGPGGRITRADLEDALRGISGGASSGLSVNVPPLPDFSKWGEISKLPYQSLRKKTAEHVGMSAQIIPHVTQHDEVDVTELEALRKKSSPLVKEKGGKLTPNVLLMKAVVHALKQFPQFNTSLDTQSNQIIQKNYYNIGIAANTPKGLMVPVIRDVDQKDLIQLAIELAELGAKAQAGKISLNELQGGCFTISNLGHLGGTGFTPIINHPEVAILGVSKQREIPRIVDGKVQGRLMMPLSLSYDHRVIDGVDGIQFTRAIAEYLESCGPFLLNS